ncbi:lysylphosphatidylglycerol synthase transmembrane domain-containing protein [Pedococcus sp. KACC 23699]|uniref:Lysylphosphatidylglycerol synthase transmembrane domain-containing protein n=1 Tax=Pedococcus sp. KACC 23699 TaxID=3149228 RepID=A0AAU7JSK0_9MICO
MPRRGRWTRLRRLAAVGVLGVLVWRLGTGPFLAGFAQVDVWSLVAGTGLAVVTTLCCAWRWMLVSRGLGVAVSLPSAVAACYRSQFVNLATPGGVLGDVDRAVRHGRGAQDTSSGLRSVLWDRAAGQAVLLATAGALLVLLPSPVRDGARTAGIALVAVTLALLGVVLVFRRRPPSVSVSAVSRVRADVRAVGVSRHSWSWILLASAVALSCHVLTFFVAARTAGTGGATVQVLPLALLVILAMGLPNVAGWGPREGAAAWAFGAGGLGAQQGVATAVVYGVMVFVGALPGAIVLLAHVIRRDRRVPGG